jgi:hypothetical protein
MGFIELSKENYKDYLPLDIAAFSYAFAGAMGDAGGVIIITTDGKVYYLNYCEQPLNNDDMYAILPILSQCELPVLGEIDRVPDGWKHISLGAGNNLLMQVQYVEPFFEKHEEYAKMVDKIDGLLYRSWLQIMHEIILLDAKKNETERWKALRDANRELFIDKEDKLRKVDLLRQPFLKDLQRMGKCRLEADDDLIKLSAIGLQILVELEQYDGIYNHLCADSLLDFSCLEISECAKLKVQKCQQQGLGDISTMYVELPDGTKSFKIFNHISFYNSIAGAWKAYLLFRLKSYLPTFWHAIYETRRYIYRNDELKSIPVIMRDNIDLSEHGYDITPVVYYDKEKFYVSACYWNDWQGLLRETVRIELTDGKASFEEIDQQVLYAYDCQILF